jgi:hypothetical protein
VAKNSVLFTTKLDLNLVPLVLVLQNHVFRFFNITALLCTMIFFTFVPSIGACADPSGCAVCGHLTAGITGSDSSEGTDVRPFCLLCVV